MQQKKLLFLSPYPFGKAPSQRFRYEQYLSKIESQVDDITLHSFFNDKTWETLYLKGSFFKKITSVLFSYLKRVKLFFKINQFSHLFIHREIDPIGPPFFALFLKLFYKGIIIYDFDDAIWMPNYSESNKIFSILKWYNYNTKFNCKIATEVVGGNQFLTQFAKKNGAIKTNIIPTTIDTENWHNKIKKYPQNIKKLKIGWTGSHSTVNYLQNLVPVFESLQTNGFPFEVHVISDQSPNFTIPNLHFTKWNKESEIDDLLLFDIGIMPLKDSDWTRGKCGFKALQYMALGIPSIVSPVGVNTEIVNHNENGWIAHSEEEWLLIFSKIIENPEILTDFSLKARKKIIKYYSVLANTDKFLNLFLQNNKR